ncbi:MAG: hypothetical protein RCG15_05695 [Candidatus Rickettsia vulgarisii]
MKINHSKVTSYAIIITTEKNEILVRFDDINNFNIKEEYLSTAKININNIDYISLNKLIGTNYNLNLADLSLEITYPVDKMLNQHYSADPTYLPISSNYIKGLYLNYDLTFTSELNNKYAHKHLAGIQEFNYFSEQGVLTNSVLLNLHSSKTYFIKYNKKYRKYHNINRLETYWTFENLEQMTKLRVGDNITTAVDWGLVVLDLVALNILLILLLDLILLLGHYLIF